MVRGIGPKVRTKVRVSDPSIQLYYLLNIYLILPGEIPENRGLSSFSCTLSLVPIYQHQNVTYFIVYPHSNPKSTIVVMFTLTDLDYKEVFEHLVQNPILLSKHRNEHRFELSFFLTPIFIPHCQRFHRNCFNSFQESTYTFK